MRGTAAAVFAKSSLFEQTIPASVEISDIESVAPCLAFFASRVSGSELLTDLSEHMRTAGSLVWCCCHACILNSVASLWEETVSDLICNHSVFLGVVVCTSRSLSLSPTQGHGPAVRRLGSGHGSATRLECQRQHKMEDLMNSLSFRCGGVSVGNVAVEIG